MLLTIKHWGSPLEAFRSCFSDNEIRATMSTEIRLVMFSRGLICLKMAMLMMIFIKILKKLYSKLAKLRMHRKHIFDHLICF